MHIVTHKTVASIHFKNCGFSRKSLFHSALTVSGVTRIVCIVTKNTMCNFDPNPSWRISCTWLWSPTNCYILLAMWTGSNGFNHTGFPGYTVTSVVSARSGQLYVAGAPRFNHTGKVIVFTMQNDGNLTILYSLKGQQVINFPHRHTHIFTHILYKCRYQTVIHIHTHATHSSYAVTQAHTNTTQTHTYTYKCKCIHNNNKNSNRFWNLITYEWNRKPQNY